MTAVNWCASLEEIRARTALNAMDAALAELKEAIEVAFQAREDDDKPDHT